MAKAGETMANGFIESIEKVEEYLEELRIILCSDNFDLEHDFDILFGTTENSTGYKNVKTIEDLRYKKSDIRNVLLSLTVNDYSETLSDVNNPDSPPLYVFGKTINAKDVYIKVKIRNRANRQVFCLSFHFAQFPISKPYLE